MPTNRSKNGRPPNSIGDVGKDNLPEDVARSLSKAGYESFRYQEQFKVLGATADIFEDAARNPSMLSDPNVQRSLERRRGAIDFMDMYEETSRRRTISQVESGINRSFGSMNGEIQRGLGTFGAQQASLSMAAKMDPETLERQRAASNRRMTGFESQIRNIAANRLVNKFGEEDPEARKEMSELYGRVEVEKGRQMKMEGAGKIHRLQGIDPASRTASLIESVNMAQNISTTGGTRAEEKAASKLIDAFEKLSKVSDTLSEEYKGLRDEAAAAERGLRAAVASGDNRGRTFGTISQIATMGANVLQQTDVNQRLAQMQNISGFANIENQKYATWQAAQGGDILSQMMLGQFAGAASFGRGVGQGASDAVFLQGVGGAAGAVANKRAGNPAGGLSGVGNLAISLMDWTSDISRDQARIAGTNVSLEASRSLLEIPAKQIQGFRDYTVGLGTAGIGMGSRGAAFLDQALSKGNMANMVSARISPEQYAQMSQFGAANMGSTFSGDQIYASRNLERSNLGTMQDQMTRMSRLSASGANNPREGLEGMMSAALSKSLDSSKALNMIAENTGALASNSIAAAAGLDASNAAATMATAAIAPNTPNQEFAVGRSKNIEDFFNQRSSGTGMNYRDLLATTRLQKGMNVSPYEARRAQSLDDVMVKSLLDTANAGNTGKLRGALNESGLFETAAATDSEMIRRVKALAMNKTLSKTTTLSNNMNADAEGVFRRVAMGELNVESLIKSVSGGPLTGISATEQAAVQRTVQSLQLEHPNMTTSEALRTAAGLTAGDTAEGKKRTKDSFNYQETNSAATAIDDMRTLGFKGLATAAETATEKLGGVAEALRAIVGASQDMDKALKEKEGEFTDAAGRSAGSGGVDVVGFGKAVDKFVAAMGGVKSSGIKDTQSGGVWHDPHWLEKKLHIPAGFYDPHYVDKKLGLYPDSE